MKAIIQSKLKTLQITPRAKQRPLSANLFKIRIIVHIREIKRNDEEVYSSMVMEKVLLQFDKNIKRQNKVQDKEELKKNKKTISRRNNTISSKLINK